MSDFAALKLELQDQKYNGKSDVECFEMLLDKNIPSKKPVSALDIRKYLALQDKLHTLLNSNLASAKRASQLLDLFDTFSLNETDVLNTFTFMLDALITDGLIDINDRTKILALGDSLISRSEQLGFDTFRLIYVRECRL